MGQEELRRRAAELATSIVGLSADPERADVRARYIALIAPDETAPAQTDMAQMSPGGLVIAGIWRGVGVDAPELRAPYVTGTALSRLIKIARRTGAWVAASPGALPLPGDAVHIGGDASGPDHMYTVVAVTPGDPAEVRAVAGFKGANKAPSVIALTHRWSGGRDTADDPTGGPPIVRNVRGWIDLTKLPIPAQGGGDDPTDPVPPPLDERRRSAIAAATSIVGLSANPKDPGRRRRYLDFVAPGVAPERESEIALREGSALVAAGVLRALGLPPLFDVTKVPAPPKPTTPGLPVDKSFLLDLFATYKNPSALLIAPAAGRAAPPEPVVERPRADHVPANPFVSRFLGGAIAGEIAGRTIAHLPQMHVDPRLADPKPVVPKPVDPKPAAPPALSEDMLALLLKPAPYAVPSKPNAPDPRAETDAATISPFAAAFGGDIAGQYLRLLGRGRIDGADTQQLVAEARRIGAWVPWAGGSIPLPGDLMLAGVEGASAGRVYVVTSVTGYDGGDPQTPGPAGTTITGVESQRDGDGYACVVTRDHRVSDGVDVVVGAHTAGTTAPLTIDGWIDLSRIQPAPVAPGPEPTPDPKPETIRERAVRVALSLVGVGANPSDPQDRRSYIDLIAPGEPQGKAEDMARLSGCALVVRGIWRALGFDEPELAAPYPVGAAMAQVMSMGRRAGAWVAYAPDSLPAPGDVVLVGANGTEHVFTVTSVTRDGDRVTLESVDGGQLDADAFQIITARGRAWQNGIDRPITDAGVARHVQGFIDLDRLVTLLGSEPPPTTPANDPTGSWEDHAPGGPLAGEPIDAEMRRAIAAKRTAITAASELHETRGGHYYTGISDSAHLAYLDARVAARVAAASSDEDRMKNTSIGMLLRREGTTAAINSYDNMIVTWGMGFGGLGALPPIFDRVARDAAVRGFFRDVGIGYWGDGYHVVDVSTGKVVSGMKPALELIHGSVELLGALIAVARDPALRDAVTDAQFDYFLTHSAHHVGAAEIATQALFNFVTHLKHWAPYYATGAVAWAAAQAGGSRSEARDRELGPLIGRYFYGRTRGYSWVPSWTQFQTYALQHMKADGLDCAGDPWLTADGPTDLPNVSSNA